MDIKLSVLCASDQEQHMANTMGNDVCAKVSIYVNVVVTRLELLALYIRRNDASD